MFDYGDAVRVKESGLCADICDIKKTETATTYILDRHAYHNTDDADEWLLEATEIEIERI